VLKDKEIRLYGEFRTRRLVLEAWDALEGNQVIGYSEKQVVDVPGTSYRSIPDDVPRTADDGQSSVVNGLPELSLRMRELLSAWRWGWAALGI
jgi:hypothetical protein